MSLCNHYKNILKCLSKLCIYLHWYFVRLTSVHQFQLYEWCNRGQLEKDVTEEPFEITVRHTLDQNFSLTCMSHTLQLQVQQLIESQGTELVATGVSSLYCNTVREGKFSITDHDVVAIDSEHFTFIIKILALNDTNHTYIVIHHSLNHINVENDDGRFARFILDADGPSASILNTQSLSKPVIYSHDDAGIFAVINLFPL